MNPDPTWAVVAGAFMLGLVGSGHCIGMCGGIAGALATTTRPPGTTAVATARGRRARAWWASALHSLGRVACYSMLGAIVGGFSQVLGIGLGLAPAMRIFAGLTLLALGAHVAGLPVGFDRLERLGLRVWRRVSPLAGRVGAPDTAAKQLALGAVWGLLPCGLVYSAAAAAAATGSVLGGALSMAAFGLGTLPAMVIAGGSALTLSSFLRTRGARRSAGALLALLGLWTAYGGVMAQHMGGGGMGMDHASGAMSEESHSRHH